MAATLDELKARTRTFLLHQEDAQSAAATMSPAVESAANDLRGSRLHVAPGEHFSAFRQSHMRRASEISDKLTAIAAAQPSLAGLEAALDTAQSLARTENRDLVDFALMMFITHHPEARQLPIPSLEERKPDITRPSLPTLNAEAIDNAVKGLSGRKGGVAAAIAGTQAPAVVPDETLLNWFREDVLANEHHEHWHLVYPFSGTNGQTRPREGELFFYMHEQMLARYEAERLGRNLPPAAPLDTYTDPIPYGYTPNIPGYTSRPADVAMVDIQGETVVDLERIRDTMVQAAQTGEFTLGPGQTVEVTQDLLGATEEASIASALDSNTIDHHNSGHMHIAAIPPNGGGQPGNGVMSDPATAIRDPVFFQWHTHVDDISNTWQQTQAPNNFSDAPAATIRKNLAGATAVNQSPDIILCFMDTIQAGAAAFDGNAYGAQQFGGTNWNSPFFSGGVATDTLETLFANRPVGRATVTYLDHREFAYFLRVQNTQAAQTVITVRIFLAPVDTASDRRAWIEMDKFHATLAPSAQTVIYQPGSLSSVIRKPAVRLTPGGPPPAQTQPPAGTTSTYCDCGWPYNLLLPAGQPDGMAFRLFVMLTDWNKDNVAGSTCGSVSFCGALDNYPDSRNMGYPFDRPFATTIDAVVAQQTNIATRDIQIKLTTPYPQV